MSRYGPNSAEVEALIARARVLTVEECRAFQATFGRESDPRFRAAFDAIQQATFASGRNQAYIAAYDHFAAAVDRSPGGRALGSGSPAGLIHEVVTATVVRDLIAPQDFDYATEPWRLVINEGFRPPVERNVQYIDFSAPARSSGCLILLAAIVLMLATSHEEG